MCSTCSEDKVYSVLKDNVAFTFFSIDNRVKLEAHSFSIVVSGNDNNGFSDV